MSDPPSREEAASPSNETEEQSLLAIDTPAQSSSSATMEGQASSSSVDTANPSSSSSDQPDGSSSSPSGSSDSSAPTFESSHVVVITSSATASPSSPPSLPVWTSCLFTNTELPLFTPNFSLLSLLGHNPTTSRFDAVFDTMDCEDVEVPRNALYRVMSNLGFTPSTIKEFCRDGAQQLVVTLSMQYCSTVTSRRLMFLVNVIGFFEDIHRQVQMCQMSPTTRYLAKTTEGAAAQASQWRNAWKETIFETLKCLIYMGRAGDHNFACNLFKMVIGILSRENLPNDSDLLAVADITLWYLRTGDAFNYATRMFAVLCRCARKNKRKAVYAELKARMKSAFLCLQTYHQGIDLIEILPLDGSTVSFFRASIILGKTGFKDFIYNKLNKAHYFFGCVRMAKFIRRMDQLGFYDPIMLHYIDKFCSNFHKPTTDLLFDVLLIMFPVLEYCELSKTIVSRYYEIMERTAHPAEDDAQPSVLHAFVKRLADDYMSEEWLALNTPTPNLVFLWTEAVRYCVRSPVLKECAKLIKPSFRNFITYFSQKRLDLTYELRGFFQSNCAQLDAPERYQDIKYPDMILSTFPALLNLIDTMFLFNDSNRPTRKETLKTHSLSILTSEIFFGLDVNVPKLLLPHVYRLYGNNGQFVVFCNQAITMVNNSFNLRYNAQQLRRLLTTMTAPFQYPVASNCSTSYRQLEFWAHCPNVQLPQPRLSAAQLRHLLRVFRICTDHETRAKVHVLKIFTEMMAQINENFQQGGEVYQFVNFKPMYDSIVVPVVFKYLEADVRVLEAVINALGEYSLHSAVQIDQSIHFLIEMCISKQFGSQVCVNALKYLFKFMQIVNYRLFTTVKLRLVGPITRDFLGNTMGVRVGEVAFGEYFLNLIIHKLLARCYPLEDNGAEVVDINQKLFQTAFWGTLNVSSTEAFDTFTDLESELMATLWSCSLKLDKKYWEQTSIVKNEIFRILSTLMAKNNVGAITTIVYWALRKLGECVAKPNFEHYKEVINMIPRDKLLLRQLIAKLVGVVKEENKPKKVVVCLRWSIQLLYRVWTKAIDDKIRQLTLVDNEDDSETTKFQREKKYLEELVLSIKYKKVCPQPSH